MSMILTAHQPVYLPWLGLFHKIAISDAFCYFDNVQYQIKDWNNRNKIKTLAGEVWLTVPILSRGYRDKKIREIEIDNSTDWRKKHWKTLFLSYKKAPYFSQYASFIEEVYTRDWQYLTDINAYMLKWFLEQLHIKIDYYQASILNFEGYKSELVLDMCMKLHADTYVFGALGKGYAQEQDFKNNGVNIYFQNYLHPTYPQLYGKFLPNMSILDLLFNCGDKSYEVLMGNNISKDLLISLYDK